MWKLQVKLLPQVQSVINAFCGLKAQSCLTVQYRRSLLRHADYEQQLPIIVCCHVYSGFSHIVVWSQFNCHFSLKQFCHVSQHMSLDFA